MFFKDNLKAISAKNNALAQRLSEIYLVNVQENIDVYISETGEYVFSYDGLVLDDMINPAGDAAMNCKENIPSDFSYNDIIVVFGLGAGYLLNYVSKNYTSHIIFYEQNLNILRYGIEFLDLKDVFMLPNVQIASNAQNVIDDAKELLTGTNKRLAVLYPAAYEQLIPDELNFILTQMTGLLSDI